MSNAVVNRNDVLLQLGRNELQRRVEVRLDIMRRKFLREEFTRADLQDTVSEVRRRVIVKLDTVDTDEIENQELEKVKSKFF